MSSRIEKMLAKTQGIRAARDIPDSEVVRSATPKTAVGTMAAWQAAQIRIEELESQLAESGEDRRIPVAAIAPNPWQPRRVFDLSELNKLAESIAEVGLIQPVIVRSVGNPNISPPGEECVGIPNTRYQLVAGERRWRAHKILGKVDIKVIVIEATDEEMAALALAENIDRQDLTAYEIALAIRNAESAFPSRKSLAACLGINRSDLYSYLAFFSLPGFIIDDLDAAPGLIGRDAAKDIKSAIDNHGARAEVALRSLWPRVKSRDIEQGKIAALIEASLTRSEHVRTERDIRKLFVGKEQAGSITRDASKLKIEIKAAALTPESEAELRRFVEGMFKSGG